MSIPLEELLAFEHRQFRHQGAKESAVRNEFGIRLTRYWQILNAAIDNPEALQLDPQLIHRLADAREKRVAKRAARSFTRK